MQEPERPSPDTSDNPHMAETRPAPAPLLNYTLAKVCPACDAPTFRLACKVRCARCGFMWDCSEL